MPVAGLRLTALKRGNRTCGVECTWIWDMDRCEIDSINVIISAVSGGLKAGNKTVKGGRQRQRQPLKYANVDCLHLFLLLLHIGATSTGQGREDGSSTDKRRENNRYPGQVGPRCLSLAFDASSCTSFAALICRPLIYLAKLYIHTPIYIYVL